MKFLFAFLVLLLLAAADDFTDLDLPVDPKYRKAEPIIEEPPEVVIPEPPPPPEVDWFGEKVVIPGGVVFIIDKSGSMSHSWDKTRSRLQVAVQETIRSVKELRADAKFDVMAFSSHMVVLWGKVREASDAAKDEAIAWLEGLGAGGGTDTGTFTTWALVNYGHSGQAKDFLLLSDGSPSRAAEALKMIAGADTSKIKVHTFSVDQSSSGEEWMKECAAVTGGTFRQVR